MKKVSYYNIKNIKKENIEQYKEIEKNIAYKINDSWSRCFELGYETFGILLYGLCNWIHNDIKKNKIDKIFFLSRDGYIIKKVYNILYPDEKTEYLYISRRSLSLPTMYLSENYDEKFDCMVLPPIFNIETFLSNINIKCNEVSNEIKRAKISYDELFKRSEIKKNPKLKELMMQLDRKINAEKKYNNFINYLDQLDFCGNVAIVDIGWHNSIQKNLIKIVSDRNVKINGYYLGIYDDAKVINKPNTAKGYLYSYGNNIDLQNKTFSFVSLLESYFLAHEGTTVTYKNKKNTSEVVPVLDKYEYTDKKMIKIINEYQDGALEFVKDFKNCNLMKNISPDISSANIVKLGCHPQKKDLSIFEQINFENYTINNIVNYNHSAIYYMLHPKKMIYDFFKSGWRIVFLKKLFIIPFPTMFVFNILCKLSNRR